MRADCQELSQDELDLVLLGEFAELAMNSLPQFTSSNELEPLPCAHKRSSQIWKAEGHNSGSCQKEFPILTQLI